jgi:hypothetical protein
MKGLLGRASLAADEGLFIPDCSSIHTWFMQFPIDVVFFDANMAVCRVAPGLRPWRLAIGWGARHIVELPAGGAAAAGLTPGVRAAWAADAVEARPPQSEKE